MTNWIAWIVKYSHDDELWFKYGADGVTPYAHRFRDRSKAEAAATQLTDHFVAKYTRVRRIIVSDQEECPCAMCKAGR